MDRLSFGDQSDRIARMQQASRDRKRRLQGEEARYTLVLHSARKQLDVTINEYCLCDTVNKIS